MRHATSLASLLAIIPSLVGAEQLDPTFSGDGLVLYNQPNQDHGAVATLAMPNGETVVVIDFPITPSLCPSAPCFALSRVTPLGVRLNERVVIRLGRAKAAAVDGSGRIIVIGPTAGADTGKFGIMRFKADLADDTSFSDDGYATVDFPGINDGPEAVAIDAQDNIVVAGYTVLTSNDYDFAVARLRSNGQLDTSFSTDGLVTVPFDLSTSSPFYDSASTVSIGNDGKILIGGGAFDSTQGISRVALTRLNRDGNQDSSFCAAGCLNPGYPQITAGRTIYYFGANTPHSDYVASVDVLGNGGFVIAGSTPGAGFEQISGAIARFNPNGTYAAERIEPGLGGFMTFDDVKAIDAAGTRIVAAGSSGEGEAARTLVLQALNAALTPVTGYGNCLVNTSAICVAASVSPGAHYSGDPAIDVSGRPLLNGNGALTDGGLDVLLVGRVTNTSGPLRETLFRTGFN